MHTVGSEEGAGVGDDVGTWDGTEVGEFVGGSGVTHREARQMLSSEQHASSTSHVTPGRTHILPVGAIVGAWVGIAVGAGVGSGVSGAIIFMVGLAVAGTAVGSSISVGAWVSGIGATVVTIGSGTKSKSIQSLFACGLNSNPII